MGEQFPYGIGTGSRLAAVAVARFNSLAKPATVASPTQNAAAETTPRPQSGSLFGPVVDFLCGGSLTFLVFLPVLLLNITTPEPAFVTTLLIWGNILVNFPHYAATYYRVYRSTDEIRKYPVHAMLVPAVLSLVAAACFAFPSSMTPWVAFLYLATSGYHYAGQTYGVSMIFLGKSGLRLTDAQKRTLRFPLYASYAYTLVDFNLADRVRPTVFETVVPGIGLPAAVLDVCAVAVLVSVALYVALNVATYRREGRVFPPVVNVMIAAHIVWFTMVQFPILMAVVPFLHCLQYLMVTAFFDFKEAMARTGRKDLSPAKYFGSKLFARYYATQVAIGFGIFMISPAVLSSLGAGSKALAGAVVVSVVNLHHFLLDGAIWKLRKPAVGRPLLT